MTRKKILLITAITTAVTLIAFILYFVTIFRAESAIGQLVNTQSNGTLFFKVKKVKLKVFQLRFEFQHPELHTIDSSNTVSGYNIKITKISFRAHSLHSLFTNKPFIVDSVVVQSPIIEVIKYKDIVRSKFSLPEEISKVYQSLETVLKVMNLNYLHISDAKFRLNDRSKPEARPFEVSSINLTINNFTRESNSAEEKFLYADRILLEIYNQDLVLPDDLHGISFKKLWMGTRSRMIKLDSCYVWGKAADSSSGEFNFFIDSLRVMNLDFNRLAKDNTIKFDTALLLNSDIDFKLKLDDKSATKTNILTGTTNLDKDSIDNKLKTMLGNLDIGFLTVRNARINISAEKNNKTNLFNTQNSNFSLWGLKVNSEVNVPMQLARLDLNLHDYTGYSPDSLYIIMFDHVIMQANKIQLNNFRINPVKPNNDILKKEIKMQVFELHDIDWMALLYEHRIVAGRAYLIKPEVDMVLPKKGGKSADKPKHNPFKVMETIKDKIQIGKLFIEDGKMRFEVLHGPEFSMDNCYLGINVNQLLDSENESMIIDAIDTMSFSKGDFQNSATRYAIIEGNYSKVNSSIYFKQITERKGNKSQSVTIDNVRLSGIRVSSADTISMDEISWGKAKITFEKMPDLTTSTVKTKPATDYKFTISKLRGGPTELSIKTKSIEASTVFNHISSGEIVVASGQTPRIRNLYIDGQSINLYQKDIMHGSFDQFNVADNKPSFLNNVTVRFPVDGEMANVFIPKLTFSVDIHSSLNGKIKGDFIELNHPVISFDKMEGAMPKSDNTDKKSAGLPDIKINRITIDQPELINLPVSLQEKIQFNPGHSKLDLLGIHSDAKTIVVDSVRVSVSDPSFKSNDFQLSATGFGKIDLIGSALAYYPANEENKSKWSVYVNQLKLSDLNMKVIRNDSVKQSIALNSLNLENLHVNDTFSKNNEALLNSNKLFRVTNGNLRLENDKTRLEVYNLALTKATNNVTMDSMSFSPLMDRVTYMQEKEYQTTHNKVSSKIININDIDFRRLLEDKVIYSRKVVLNDLRFTSFKDKRLPFQHGIEKPMLTNLLLNIRPKIQVDTLVLKNGLIEYEEFNDKTVQLGKIKVSKLKGAITGIRTFDPKPSDSLSFSIYARLIDTADIRMKYKQSYLDTLSGFSLQLIVNSFNLTALNPILVPFASAELNSGNLDTIRMSVIGRKHVALGEMKMYYSGLNAQYLNKGDSSKSNMISKLISFFANRMVQSRNQRGIGTVYAERDPEKSFVNYWVKIVIGGVLTNTGVRSNNKQDRKYEKGLVKFEVQPLPDIPVDFD